MSDMKNFFLAFCLLFSANTLGSNGQYLLEIEEPANYVGFQQEPTSGISNIRGWAFSSFREITEVKLFVDGEFVSNIPYGGERRDVYNQFPDFIESLHSGFGMTYNFGELEAGSHSITVAIYDNQGKEIGSDSVGFRVNSFPEAFYSESRKPSLATSSTFTISSFTGRFNYLHELEKGLDKILIKDVALVTGESYDVTLKWSTAAQKYVISDLNEVEISPWCDSHITQSDSIDPSDFSIRYWNDGRSFVEVTNRTNFDARVERLVIGDNVRYNPDYCRNGGSDLCEEYYNLPNDGQVPAGESWIQMPVNSNLGQYAEYFIQVNGQCFRRTVERIDET